MMIATGMPAELAKAMRTEPWWAAMEAMAPTMVYDSEIMGDLNGGVVPTELVASVTVPTLVLCGGASPDWMIAVGRQICAGLPAGTLRVLEGQEHVVPPEVLAPVLVDFFGGSAG
jgi:pimeloyl-ACP methyl ester carboxylesterase